MRQKQSRCFDRETLSLLASAALPDAGRGGIESHLAECPYCRKFHADVQGVASELADWQKAFSHLAPTQTMQSRWTRDFEAASDEVPSLRLAPVDRIMTWCADMLSGFRPAWAVFALIWLIILALQLSQHRSADSNLMPAELVRAFLQSQGL